MKFCSMKLWKKKKKDKPYFSWQLYNFSLWEWQTRVCEACFIYFLFIETTVRNTTPSWQPPHLYDSLLCEGCSLAKSQKHLLLTQRCILGSLVEKEKKRRRNVRPSLWNYVTVNWANTTGAPLVRGPELVFCLCHRIPTVWPEYRITSNQSNSYLNETSNEKKFPGRHT